MHKSLTATTKAAKLLAGLSSAKTKGQPVTRSQAHTDKLLAAGKAGRAQYWAGVRDGTIERKQRERNDKV